MTRRDAVERLVHSRDESTEVRSLLEAGITDDVADYDFARGLETHLAAVGTAPGSGGGPAAPGGAGPGVSSGATSAKALALAIGVPVVSAIAALAVFIAHRSDPAAPGFAAKAPNVAVEPVAPASPARESEAVAPSVPASPPSVKAQRHSVTHSPKVGLEDHEATVPQQVVAAGSDNHSVIQRTFPEGPVPAASPSVASAPPAASPVVGDEPRPSEEAVARAERAREEARRNEEDKLQREMEELMRAKRALSSDPKLALELAERGQREFKQSLLSEEREHVLLLALIGVGRVSEAERRAAPYLAKHPDSPFARRVRAALNARKSR